MATLGPGRALQARAVAYVEAGVVSGEQQVAGVELVLVSRGRLADGEASHRHHLLEQHREQACQSNHPASEVTIIANGHLAN